MSSIKVARLNTIDTSHWQAFLTSPVDFIGSLSQVASVLAEDSDSCGTVVIEMGAHPVFTGSSSLLVEKGVNILAHVVSMMRGEIGAGFLHSQRHQGTLLLELLCITYALQHHSCSILVSLR